MTLMQSLRDFISNTHFSEQLGLYLLSLALIIILLYLIRPKPKQLSIPSLMFFLRNNRMERMSSFFRLIIKDPLMILHLLIILLLALTLAKPFLTITEDVTAKDKVIVLDISASMSAMENENSRFNIAKQVINQNLGETNTLILAADFPIIALESAPAYEVTNLIKQIQPLHTRTNIGDSIMAAVNYIDADSSVLIVSDFQNSEGTNPDVAIDAIRGLAKSVEAVSVKSDSKKFNTGFIDAVFSKNQVTAYIKNFDPVAKTITIAYENKKDELKIDPLGIAAFSFNLTKNSEFEITTKDSFELDNKLFIAVPESLNPKIQIISNNPSKYLTAALQSVQGTSLSFAEPPIIPKDDFDIYVFTDVDYESILPGSMEHIRNEILNGKTLVIVAEPNFEALKFKDLIPLTINETLGSSAVYPGVASPITASVRFEPVDMFYHAFPIAPLETLAFAGDVPIITLSNFGSGKVLFYGIMENKSRFHKFPAYPVFWSQFIGSITAKTPLERINLRTGSSITGTKISLPEGQTREGVAHMDIAGYYTSDDMTYSANLLSAEESDISKTEASSSEPIEDFKPEPIPIDRDISLIKHIIYIILILLFIDLAYARLRGDF